jgi:hypothetical protein
MGIVLCTQYKKKKEKRVLINVNKDKKEKRKKLKKAEYLTQKNTYVHFNKTIVWNYPLNRMDNL